MSTTIELHLGARGGWRAVACCGLALGIWFASLIVAALAFEPTRAVIVIGSGAAIASAQQADVDLLDASGAIVTVAGRSDGFVRRLYAAGAWLVLPAGSGGCRAIASRRGLQTS